MKLRVEVSGGGSSEEPRRVRKFRERMVPHVPISRVSLECVLKSKVEVSYRLFVTMNDYSFDSGSFLSETSSVSDTYR